MLTDVVTTDAETHEDPEANLVPEGVDVHAPEDVAELDAAVAGAEIKEPQEGAWPTPPPKPSRRKVTDALSGEGATSAIGSSYYIDEKPVVKEIFI